MFSFFKGKSNTVSVNGQYKLKTDDINGQLAILDKCLAKINHTKQGIENLQAYKDIVEKLKEKCKINDVMAARNYDYERSPQPIGLRSIDIEHLLMVSLINSKFLKYLLGPDYNELNNEYNKLDRLCNQYEARMETDNSLAAKKKSLQKRKEYLCGTGSRYGGVDKRI